MKLPWRPLIIFCLTFGLVLGAGVGRAAVLTVTSTADSGAGSLRDQIANAVTGDQIVFDPAVTGRILLASQLVIANQSITLSGPGANLLSLDGGGVVSVLSVSGVATPVQISGLTITNGFTSGTGGGGIFNAGSLALINCSITGNRTTNGTSIGGGIYTGNGSTLSLVGCTVAGNFATFGGGIYAYLPASFGLTNCTITGNIAPREGGGIMSDGNLTAISCTIAKNACTNFDGGGVHMPGGYALIGNCLIVGNTSTTTAKDLSGEYISLGYNFVGITNGTYWGGGLDALDRLGSLASPLDPQLGPLQRNGGPTLTMSPLPGSPVIDQGNSFGVVSDQRGFPRPVDFDSIVNSPGGDGSDIGAVEVSLPSNLTYEWDFNQGDLSAALGPGVMAYADAATPGLTGFGTTDGATVPHIAGQPAAYMHVPAFSSLANGYLVTLAGSPPNGGGQYINQYTFIADVLIPGPINWTPFFNTNPLNQNDADFYVSPSGGVGISGVYSGAGTISPGVWYRVAFVADLTTSALTFFVNGTQLVKTYIGALDGRWSLFSNLDPGADLLLFNEGAAAGVYTHELYVAHLAVVDRNLDPSEIAALGGPVWDGIFVRQPPRVRVDASQPVRTADARWFGVNTAIWEGAFDTPDTFSALNEMGCRALRFPGGSFADLYHWSSNYIDGSSYEAWPVAFGNFVDVATNLGAQVFITANYGTGTAEEAADWVRAANITNHCNFKYWELGNECYGLWEADGNTNAPYLAHDPWTYAMRFQDYYNQMKAVDPSIKVGVVGVPYEDNFANNLTHAAFNPRTGQTHYGWTPVLLATLQALGVTPDFVVHHYYPEYQADDDATLLQAASNWAADAASFRQMITDYFGPGGASIELLCTENNADAGAQGRQSTSLVNGLYLADSLSQLMKTEFNSFLWWDLQNGQDTNGDFSATLYGWRTYGDLGLMLDANTRYPTYYAMKLMQYFAGPADTVLNAISSQPLLSTYAAQHADGTLSLLAINKDPASAHDAQFNLAGFVPWPSAIVRSYGIAQDEATRTNAPASAQDIALTFYPAASANFSYSFPPYSLTLFTFGPSNAIPAAPQLSPVSAGDRFVFQLRGQSNIPFILQSSTDLTTWVSRQTNVTVNGVLTVTVPISPDTPKEFWRAVWAP